MNKGLKLFIPVVFATIWIQTCAHADSTADAILFPVRISTYSVLASSTSESSAMPPVTPAVSLPLDGSPIVSIDHSPPLTSTNTAQPVLLTTASLTSSTATPVSILPSTSGIVSPIVTSAPPLQNVLDVLPTQAIPAPSLLSTALSPDHSARPLTLDLRDMDVVDALKLLARQNDINMVIGKNVSGRVTVLLNKVDFWGAFRTILSTRDLAYVQNGDLIEVMNAQDYERSFGVAFDKRTHLAIIPLHNVKAQTVKAALEPFRSKIGSLNADELTNSIIIEEVPENFALMKERITQFDQLQETRVFRLSYALAEDLLGKISPLVSKDFGSAQADKRSNTIVVQDNPVRLREIAELIHSIDVRDKAVLIEAKIIQITLSKRFQWGINWQGVNWSAIFDQLNHYHIAGKVAENLLLVPPETVTGNNVTATGITAQVGVLEKPDFQAVINALDTVGTTNLLSSPRVIALNRQEAKIHVGSKVAKITRSIINAGSTTSAPITTENVEFLDVGVKLSVTPVIGDDNTITMKVLPEVSSVENTITTSDGSSIPVIRVSEAESSLVVKDGITMVIGGLIEDSRAKTDNDVPILGRIPLIGYLFRSRDTSQLKTELVIFITPHIVNADEVPPEAQTRFNLEPDGTPKPKKGFFRRLFGH